MELLKIKATLLGEINKPDFCERCFWIKLHYSENQFPFQIPMPGIFSSIDGYSKKIIHRFFDKHRCLPSWFPDIGEIKDYIKKLHYSKFQWLDKNTNILISGTPDDIFLLVDNSYHIVDYKTAKITEK